MVHVGSGLQPRWDRVRRFGVAMRLLPSLDVRPLITHRFPLEEAARAYALVDRDPRALGVVLEHS